MHDARARYVQADPDHQILEDLPVFALEDRLAVGADHLHAVLRQDALVEAGHARVEARLPAERGEQRVDRRALGLFVRQDLLDGFGGDRLDVGRIRELRVGHDRGRIGVDQDDAITFLLQRPARLHAGVVELAPLPDDDRAGADDEDRVDVRAFWHISTALSRGDLRARPGESRMNVSAGGSMSTFGKMIGLLLAASLLTSCTKSDKPPTAATQRVARPIEVEDRVDWEKFLARHDLVWKSVPETWGEAAFTGNGLLGLMMYKTDDKSALRFRVGRSDVMIQEKQAYRVPIGDLVLKPVGKITGGNFRQDLWDAEVTGKLVTDKGEIGVRFFTHANDLINVIELKPSQGESAFTWTFEPGLSANPRWLRDKQPIPEDEKSPPVKMMENAAFQKVFNGDEYGTVWKEQKGDAGERTLYTTVAYVKKSEGAIDQANSNIDKAMQAGVPALAKSHRQWWHAFYPKSFLSVPDTRLESFYWIQLYKLASATREDRPAIDLAGPWYNDTPWPRIWWNLNIQLTYYPVYMSNHLELGASLCRMIDNGAKNLAANAGEFSSDSETISRTSGYDLRAPNPYELCNLPWALHNYYMQYRHSMDDAMLRDRLFPRLKRAMNYYLHFLQDGPDGKLHMTRGHSPEYPKQPRVNPDCNIDLGLIRWGCQALLDSCERLKIDDPLIPKWKDTLARLTPYPTDENGLMVSASMGWKESHRHYSHLLMIYPLYVMNWDQPENRALMAKSFDHWMSLPSAFRGYSWTGAASMAAAMERPDDAVKYLNEFLNPEGRYKSLANTHYMEAGPVIETPLSAARSLQDILLTSWGGTIRLFPGVPASWKDVTIDKMRTEGAFLVSASRRDGKTQWIRIESLAGEPCRLRCDINELQADRDIAITKLDNGVVEIGLNKGESVVLYARGREKQPDVVIEPVAAQEGRTNTFGLP
jgi:hypothetical protein